MLRGLVLSTLFTLSGAATAQTDQAWVVPSPADPTRLGVPASRPEPEWPRLPTDDELAAAMADYAARLQVAVPTVRVTLGEPIKMHAPGARNPTQSAMAVFPYHLASDHVRLTPFCIGIVDYWTDLGFHVGSSFISGCYDTTEGRAAALRGYLLEAGGWRVLGFPTGNFRLELAPFGEDGLGFTARLLRLDPADPQAAPVPAAGETLVVHAFDHEHNAWKLADAFRANGEEDSRLAHLADRDAAPAGPAGTAALASHSPAAQAAPLELTTDADGRVTLEFLLDFGRLVEGDRSFDDVFVPRCNQPLAIEVPVAYELRPTPTARPVELARARARLSVRHVARVVRTGFLEPLMEEPTIEAPPNRAELLRPARPTYPRRTGTLDEYTGDELGAARITVRGDPLCTLGTGLGVPLALGGRLSFGDRLVFRATDMTVGGRSLVGVPREPGVIWVELRFLDGVEGQVQINGLVRRWEMGIGGSAEASGFTPSGMGFVYWAGEQVTEEGVKWVARRVAGKLAAKLIPVYETVDTAQDVWSAIRWLVGATPRYVRLRSQLLGEAGPGGTLALTTREGEPRIYGPDLDPAGVAVPAGRTAFVSDSAVRVEATEAWRAGLADALLAGDVPAALALQPAAVPPVVPGRPDPAGAAAPTAGDAPAPAGERRLGLAVWAALAAVGGALLGAVIVLVVVLVRRARRG